MAEATNNSTANVSTGKGVKGGYAFVAPVGTTLPTDYSTALDAEFKNLGYISEDGVTLTVDEDNDSLNDMNGDPMDTSFSGRVEEEQVTFAEIKENTLKVMYGSDNVSDENGTITVKHNANNHDEFVYVFEFELKNKRKWRFVVPDGQLLSLDDLQISSGNLAARQATIKNLQDANGNTCYSYIQSTETAATTA